MTAAAPRARSTVETRHAVALFVVAWLLRLAYIVLRRHDPLPPNSDPYYFSLIAQHLVEGQGFLELKARAYRPPGFPWLLAAVYATVGVRLTAARIVVAALGAAHCLAQVAWVRRLASPRAGWCAGWLTAVYPQFVRYPHELYSEVLYLLLLALTLVLALDAVDSRSARRMAAAGVVCGLAALTRETALLLPLIAGVWLAAEARGQSARPGLGRLGLVFAVATGLTVLPWTIRNYQVLGTVVPVATNSGINFYMGNNPAATGDYGWVVAPGVDWDNGGHEVQASREGLRAGLRYAAAHPARTVELWFVKLWILWRPPLYGFGGLGLVGLALRAAWLVAYLALLALAVAGRPEWPRLGAKMWLVWGLLAGPTLPHLAAYASTRYRLPLEAVLIGLSAVGLARLLARFAGSDSAPDRTP